MSELVVDDFLGGSGSDAAIGLLGWRTSTGTVTPASGTTDHPGTIRLTTGASTNDACRIRLGALATTAIADIGQVLRWSATVVLGGVTNVLVRVGWGTNLSSATFGTDGVWWSASTAAGGTWVLNCRSGGVTTSVDSGVAISTDWVLLACFRQDTRWIGVVLEEDGTETLVTSSGNEPANGTGMNAGFHLETLTNAARTLDVDAWGMRYARAWALRKYL